MFIVVKATAEIYGDGTVVWLSLVVNNDMESWSDSFYTGHITHNAWVARIPVWSPTSVLVNKTNRSALIRGHPQMSTFSWVYKQYTFFRPLSPPPQVYRPTFWGSKTRVSHSTTFIMQQQKLTHLRRLLFDKWYLWQCIMIYRLQLIIYNSKFNLKIYFLCIQRKYVQFDNIKIKMTKSQLLIVLETSFKNWKKAQNVNIYFPSKA